MNPIIKPFIISLVMALLMVSGSSTLVNKRVVYSA